MSLVSAMANVVIRHYGNKEDTPPPHRCGCVTGWGRNEALFKREFFLNNLEIKTERRKERVHNLSFQE